MKKSVLSLSVFLVLSLACVGLTPNSVPIATHTQTPPPSTTITPIVVENMPFQATAQGPIELEILISTPTRSYENFAFTADTCVGMDDSGKLLLIVRTSIGVGIDLPDGLQYLSCWIDHPSDYNGYQWYTSPQLPSDIKELQLYEGDGFPSINYCHGECSTTEDPIWEGWVESSQSNQSIWEIDQKITNNDAFYPDGFLGEITYDFYTR